MSYGSILDCMATIRRVTQSSDAHGTPQTPTLTLIGNIRCAVSRQNITAAQGAPMVETGKSFRLYFLRDAPVLEGDIAEVPGHGKFRLAAPYCPRGHHIEADGSWEGEA